MGSLPAAILYNCCIIVLLCRKFTTFLSIFDVLSRFFKADVVIFLNFFRSCNIFKKMLHDFLFW